MVEMYHLARDSAIQAREVACGDEDLFIPTFHWWLIIFEWERDPDAA